MIGSDTKISSRIQQRREIVFLILSGLFLGSLTMLNILGVSRFVDLSDWVGLSANSSVTFSIAIGVLPYPITFLCTDFISEIYGRKRANRVVWVGLLLNIWILLVLWFGGWLDAPENLQADGTLPLKIVDGEIVEPHGYAFYSIRSLAFGATIASMIAYITAQFIDVHIFHFFKKATKGKKLWLRNNGSTLISQLVDSISVILITHYFAGGLPIKEGSDVYPQLMAFIISAYLFKVVVALLDTIPFYIGTKFLRNYLKVDSEVPIH
ncbi:MAG: queuosine precursor transporter [Brumimicrobium sp.]